MEPPTSPEANLDLLPTEVIYQILLKASLADIASFCLTSTKAAGYCKDDGFWQAKYWQDFGQRPLPEGMTWKEGYRQYATLQSGKAPISAGFSHYGLIDDGGNFHLGGQYIYGRGAKKLKLNDLITIPFQTKAISVACIGAHTSVLTSDGNVYQMDHRLGMPSPIDQTGKLVKMPSPIMSLKDLDLKGIKLVEGGAGYGVILEGGFIYLNVALSRSLRVDQLFRLEEGTIDLAIGDERVYILTKDGVLHVLLEGTRGTLTTRVIPVPEKVRQISTGQNHLIILSINGNVYTMGNNESGQLGTMYHQLNKSPVPLKLNLPHPIIFISAGADVSAAISEGGRLYMWGNTTNSNILPVRTAWGLPDKLVRLPTVYRGSDTYILAPVEIGIGGKARYVAVGSNITVAMTEDGAINNWGDPNLEPI